MFNKDDRLRRDCRAFSSNTDDPIDDDVDIGVDFGIDEPQDAAQLVEQDYDAAETVVVAQVVEELGATESLVGGTGDVPSTGDVHSAQAGVRRSTRERKQVKSYEPSMTGKKYSFAAMMLDRATSTMLRWLMHLCNNCP